MEERISRLEDAHAFLERTVEQLNDALCLQQQEIDRLSARVRELEAQLSAGLDNIVDKRPPHY